MQALQIEEKADSPFPLPLVGSKPKILVQGTLPPFSSGGEKNLDPFGYHHMVDCYDCQSSELGNIQHSYEFLDELVERIQMTKQSQPFVFKTPPEFIGKAGLSGWVPLVESGISIHTLTETSFVSIDVYSCRKFDTAEVAALVKEYFNPLDIEEKFVLRGERYFQN